jgi:hypothetical protein
MSERDLYGRRRGPLDASGGTGGCLGGRVLGSIWVTALGHDAAIAKARKEKSDAPKKAHATLQVPRANSLQNR